MFTRFVRSIVRLGLLSVADAIENTPVEFLMIVLRLADPSTMLAGPNAFEQLRTFYWAALLLIIIVFAVNCFCAVIVCAVDLLTTSILFDPGA